MPSITDLFPRICTKLTNALKSNSICLISVNLCQHVSKILDDVASWTMYSNRVFEFHLKKPMPQLVMSPLLHPAERTHKRQRPVAAGKISQFQIFLSLFRTEVGQRI